MGIGDFLSNLTNPQSGFGKAMSNPLILQYLAGVGSGLSTEGFQGGIKAASNITGQNITNQNYLKLLQRMLSGDMSGGGKLTMDKDGMKINVPTPSGGGTQMDSPMTPPSGPKTTTPSVEELFSPFASGQPSISASDLAGLNPELISQALQFDMAQNKMKMESIDAVADRAYKSKLIEQIDSQISNTAIDNEIARDEANRKIFETLTKDERTELVKNYEYAKTTEGGSFSGTLAEFKNSSDTGDWNNYQKAKEEGYKGNFENWIKTAHPATNINLSPFEQTRQRELAQSQADVLSPDFVTKTIKSLSDSLGRDWDRPYGPNGEKVGSEAEIPGLQRRILIKDMNDKIIRAFGQDNVKVSGNGWIVKIGDKEQYIRGPQ